MARPNLTICSTEVSKFVLTHVEINCVLEALHLGLKEKLPRLREPSVNSVEGVRSTGTYGFISFGILLVGHCNAKLTIVLEWETALKLASKLLNVSRLEAFSEDAQLALEDVLKTVSEKTAKLLTKTNAKVEAFPLPSIIEGNTLLSHFEKSDTIKVSIQTLWDPIQLFISCPQEAREAKNAA